MKPFHHYIPKYNIKNPTKPNEKLFMLSVILKGIRKIFLIINVIHLIAQSLKNEYAFIAPLPQVPLLVSIMN
jgi:hypothetical protein